MATPLRLDPPVQPPPQIAVLPRRLPLQLLWFYPPPPPRSRTAPHPGSRSRERGGALPRPSRHRAQSSQGWAGPGPPLRPCPPPRPLLVPISPPATRPVEGRASDTPQARYGPCKRGNL